MSNTTDGLQAIVDQIGLNHEASQQVHDTAASLPLVSFSGWLLSGKDTVALSVYRALGVPHRHLSFASAIRSELDEVIGVTRVSLTTHEAAEISADLLGIEFAQGLQLVEFILDGRDIDAERERLQVLDAHQRTPGIRRALQYLGSDIRRRQDPLYWIRQAQRAAVHELAQGRAFVFTDVRFPDEVRGLQVIGATVVRLSISRETQLERLQLRDGLQADPAALYHETETALEGFEGFDAVIDNEGPLEEVVDQVCRLATGSH